MPVSFSDFFPDSAAIDRSAPEDQRAQWAAIPAKGAVYLLVDQDDTGQDRPLLLATVGDLRAALRRRLADLPPETRSKRIAYGQLCSRVFWRRVDSSFAANWWYWRAARTLFPERYRELIPWRQSWWIAMEREGPFPRLKRTTDLSDAGLLYAGPIRDRTSAGKVVETTEDLFDLCRYHQELIQAPRGKPCAYKEMGKCPAPCDGSVPIAWYRQQMAKAWSFLTGPIREQWRDEQAQAMKSAAARLEFETAARLKQRLVRAELLEAEACAQLAPLEDFAFLTLQPGKGKPWLEPWIVQGREATCLAQVNFKDLSAAAESLVKQARDLLAASAPQWLSPEQSEQIAIVAHHLFRGDADHGVWLRLRALADTGPQLILEAAEKLRSRRAPKPLVEQSSDKETKPEAPADTTTSAITAAAPEEGR